MDTLPAPVDTGSQESVASQVTTQAADQSQDEGRISHKNPDHPLAAKPAGDEAEATLETASGETQSQEEEPKQTWKEKRQERNRQRWQEYKEAKAVLPARLASLEQEVARLKGTAPPDFNSIVDPNEEIAERAAWKVQQREADNKAAQLEHEREVAAKMQAVKLAAAWEEAREDARSRIPDFDDVVTDKTPIHARAAPFLVESEKGADVAYWLGKNPKEAEALFDKFETAPALALIELGRIEARLSAPTPKTVSTAPKPAPTLRGGVNPIAFDAKSSSVGDMQSFLKKAGVI